MCYSFIVTEFKPSIFFGDKSTSNIQKLDKITITTCDGKKSKSVAKIFDMVFFLFYYCYYDCYCF